MDFAMGDSVVAERENRANLEKKGILEIGMIYESMDWYLDIVWKNSAIEKYIEWSHSDGKNSWDVYNGCERLSKKCKAYGEAKENKQWILLWEIRWWLKEKILGL